MLVVASDATTLYYNVGAVSVAFVLADVQVHTCARKTIFVCATSSALMAVFLLAHMFFEEDQGEVTGMALWSKQAWSVLEPVAAVTGFVWFLVSAMYRNTRFIFLSGVLPFGRVRTLCVNGCMLAAVLNERFWLQGCDDAQSCLLARCAHVIRTTTLQVCFVYLTRVHPGTFDFSGP